MPTSGVNRNSPKALSTEGRTRLPVTIGDDSQIAARLVAFIREAEDGVRKIAIAGAFCDWILSRLPHGKLGEWLQTYAPDVAERTVRRWRQFARAMMEAAKYPAEVGMPAYDALAAPVEQLPVSLQEFRERFAAVAAGKTYRQLWFEFKQMAEGPDGELRVTRGCVKGDVRTPHRERRTVQAEIEARRERITSLARDAVSYMEGVLASEDLGLVLDPELIEQAHVVGSKWANVWRLMLADPARNRRASA